MKFESEFVTRSITNDRADRVIESLQTSNCIRAGPLWLARELDGFVIRCRCPLDHPRDQLGWYYYITNDERRRILRFLPQHIACCKNK